MDAEGAVLSELLEVLPEDVDVAPEDAPEEEPELLVLPELDEDEVLEEELDELVEPEVTPLTVTFRALLVTVQSL